MYLCLLSRYALGICAKLEIREMLVAINMNRPIIDSSGREHQDYQPNIPPFRPAKLNDPSVALQATFNGAHYCFYMCALFFFFLTCHIRRPSDAFLNS